MPSAAPKPKSSRWTFSLRTFLVVSLVLSLVLGYVGRVWWKAYRDSQPPTLYELAQIAKRHGMPMPPKDAKFVAAKVDSRNGMPGYAPAFLLGEIADGGAQVLKGIEYQDLEPSIDSQSPLSPPLWRDLSHDGAKQLDEYCNVYHDSDVICAIQLAVRGDTAAGEAVLKRFASHKRTPESAAADLRLIVARFAWDYHAREITKDAARWPEIRRRLSGVYQEFPQLGLECSDLLRDLSAAVDAPQPAPGSTEALLLDWSHRPNLQQHSIEQTLSLSRSWQSLPTPRLAVFQDAENGDSCEPAREIIVRGFDAIPELISLVDDTRITARWEKSLVADDRIARVGNLAEDLLWEMTGVAGLPDELPAGKEEWTRWWEEVRKERERDYFLKAVFVRAGKKIDSVQAGPARVIAQKFPEELLDLCAEFCRSADSDADSLALAEAIADANLSRDERRHELAAFAQGGPLLHKSCVLHVLAKIDPKRCEELTVRAIEDFRFDRDAGSDCAEARFAQLVAQFEDDWSWRAYLLAARKAPPAVRIEMLHELASAGKHRQLRIAFLKAFLDDPSVSTSNDFRYGAWLYTVGDLAAVQIALICDLMDTEPDHHWTREQWDALRAQVRERLKQEKLPELE